MNREMFDDEWFQQKARSKQAPDQFTDDHLEVIARKHGQLNQRIRHTYNDEQLQKKLPSFAARHLF